MVASCVSALETQAPEGVGGTAAGSMAPATDASAPTTMFAC
jgi:hypothetical protein